MRRPDGDGDVHVRAASACAASTSASRAPTRTAAASAPSSTRRDVDISDLIIRDAENQFAVILVDETTGERIVLWDRDDKLRLRERELPIEALERARVVHVDDVDDDAAIRAAGIARAAGALVTSDIDRLTPRTQELAASVTHADLRRARADASRRHATTWKARCGTLRRTLDNVLVVTMGERGAMALDGDRFHHEPAFSVHALDTTGAGDVFRGGFIYALVRRPADRAGAAHRERGRRGELHAARRAQRRADAGRGRASCSPPESVRA